MSSSRGQGTGNRGQEAGRGNEKPHRARPRVSRLKETCGPRFRRAQETCAERGSREAGVGRLQAGGRIHQSSIIIHQSSIIIHQSSFINHQSSIIVHQSLLGKNIRQNPRTPSPSFSAPLGDTWPVPTVTVLTQGFVGRSPWGYEVHTLGLAGRYLGVSGQVPTR